MLPRIKTIWLEVEAIPLYKDQPLKKEVENFLNDNGFVNVISTVNHIAGDQFWINMEYLRYKKRRVRRKLFIIKMNNINIKNSILTFIRMTRYKLKIRTRLKKLF